MHDKGIDLIQTIYRNWSSIILQHGRAHFFQPAEKHLGDSGEITVCASIKIIEHQEGFVHKRMAVIFRGINGNRFC